MRWIITCIVALAAGLGWIYGISDGFKVLTTEAARARALEAAARKLPDLAIQSADGAASTLTEDLRRDGRVAIAGFFYTRCLSLCLAQGSLQERLQQAIKDAGLQNKIRLLIISFDARERQSDLARYAVNMGADPDIWQFARLQNPQDISVLLDVFGITVVPAPLGEFEHNAAFHILSPAGELLRIVSLDEPGRALELAREYAQKQVLP